MPFTPTSADPIRPTAVGQTGNLQILQRLVDALVEVRAAGLLISNDLGSGGPGGSVSPTNARSALTGWYHVTGYGAKGDGSTNDSPAIQAALDAASTAGGGVVYLQATGAAAGATIYSLGASLVHPSKVELRLGVGVILRRGTGLTSNLIRNRALTPVAYSSGSISSGSSTLTVSGGTFTSSDVGKSVVVVGAGPSYSGGSPLVAYIASVTNGTTVVLTRTAGTGVSGAAVRVYSRDSDIALTAEVGARIEAGASGQQNNTDACPILYRNVDRARVGGIGGLLFIQTTDTSGGGKYAIWMYACTQWTVENIMFDVQSDGVHIAGKSSDFIVRNIYGSTHDDSVALVGNERLTSTNVDGDLGDMKNFVIENINTACERNNVKLLPCRGAGETTGYTISGGYIRNVSGSSNSTQSHTLVLGAANDQTSDSVYSGGFVSDIRAEGISNSDALRPGVGIYECTARNVHVSRIKNLVAGNAAKIEDLTVSDSVITARSGEYGISFGIYLGTNGPTVGRVTIRNVSYANVNATRSAGLLSAIGLNTTLGTVSLDGIRCLKAAWAIGQFATTTDFYVRGLEVVDAGGLAYLTATATATFRQMVTSTTLDLSMDSGAILRSFTTGLVTTLGKVTLEPGAQLTNTDGSSSAGLGLLVSDGNQWRNLATNVSLTFSPPTAVRSLAAAAGPAQNTLNWQVPTSDGGSAIKGHKIYRGTAANVTATGTPYAKQETTATSYTDTGATAGVALYYKVVPYNNVGDGAVSSEVSATATSPSPGTVTTAYQNTLLGSATSAGNIDPTNLADPSGVWLLNGTSGATVTARPASGNVSHFLMGKGALPSGRQSIAESTTLGATGSSASSQGVNAPMLHASNVPTAASTDPTSYYTAAWNGTAVAYEIRKVSSGTTTVLGTSAAVTAPTGSVPSDLVFYDKAVDSSTGALTLALKLGGTEILSVVETTPLVGSYWGLFMRRNTTTGAAPISSNLTVTTTV